MAPALMLVAAPLMAGQGAMDKAVGEEQRGGKDECLLSVKNCKVELRPIEQKIERIRKEIGRGTAVYTNDELNILKRELNDELNTLSDFYKNG